MPVSHSRPVSQPRPVSRSRILSLIAGILALVPTVLPSVARAAANPSTPSTSAPAAKPAKPAAPAAPAGASPGTSADIVAQGGGFTLTSAELRTLLDGLSPADRAALAANPAAFEQLVRAQIVRNAALAEAKSKGFERLPATQAQLERVHDEALVRLWVAAQAIVPPDYPSDAELQSAYDSNKQALAPPTQYRISQIFISAPDGMDAGQLAAALKKEADIAAKLPTADFAQLAQTQSEHPDSAAKGGDMGYLAEDRMVPAIAAAVRGLKPGGVAGPIKTAQGIHFLKLIDTKPGAVPTLAEVHDKLVAALRARKADAVGQQFLSDYTTKLNITVNQIELAKLQQSLPH
jgi:peptidylprolyl isomerase